MKAPNDLRNFLSHQLNDDPLLLEDKVLIAKILEDSAVCAGLLFRLRLVELIGVIKFFHQLSIENLEVEKKLLARIEDQSKVLELNPALTRIFFQRVIEYSKQLQYELLDVLESGSYTDSLAKYNAFIEALKTDEPQYLAQWMQLSQLTGEASGKLEVCRGLIQMTTDRGLQTMGELSYSVRKEKAVRLFNFGASQEAKKSSQFKHFLLLHAIFL